jgi:hypothetical protein
VADITGRMERPAVWRSPKPASEPGLLTEVIK